MARKLRIREVRVRDVLYFSVATPKPHGGRRRRFFRDKREAQTYLELCRTEQRNYGIMAFALTDELRSEAFECHTRLSAIGVTLRHATDFYVRKHEQMSVSCTVADCIKKLLAAREDHGCRPRYLGDLRVRLARFERDFGASSMAEITAAQIDDWLRSLPVSGVTQNSYRRRLGTLFSFAKKRGLISETPIADVERAKERPEPVGILTVAQVGRLLGSAGSSMVPFWAIGAFAGLRTAEIQRLDWSDVDLDQGLIHVAAANAKTATRRLVTVQQNLREWLLPLKRASGPLVPDCFQKRATADREKAELGDNWPTNALRHSFASYHLAKFHDAARLALEMGNSPRMIFKHYREIVTPAAAADYWNISRPSNE
ncbi:MAG: tyrosine-type recombinase/integrase [Verrucomicrobiota bacterium]|nr:tyrosine-type recombinase/integrase [Verrucomicrobiota bacterium]